MHKADLGDDLIRYGFPLPSGDLLEGLYIDDHVLVYDCPVSEVFWEHGPDLDATLRYQSACSAANIPLSKSKAYGFSRVRDDGSRRAEVVWTAWGTQVHSPSPEVCVEPARRSYLGLLGLEILSYRRLPKDLIVRLAASFTHPFLHLKPLLSSFHRIYKLLADI